MMLRHWLAMLILLTGSLSWDHRSATAGAPASAEPVRSVGQSRDGRLADARHVDRSATRDLHPDLIRKTIQRYLEGEWGARVKTVHVVLLEPSDSIVIPSGLVELHVLPSAWEEGLGRRTFRIAVNLNGRPWRTIDALADVAAMIDAVAPNRFLKSDEVIGAEDLTTTRIRIHDLKHQFITDQDEVIGKVSARPLQAETPLRHGFLKKPVMVKKGDRVVIEAKRGGLSIQTSGVTKSNGEIGQSIIVANLDSGRELRAKIVAPGLVQVEF